MTLREAVQEVETYLAGTETVRSMKSIERLLVCARKEIAKQERQGASRKTPYSPPGIDKRPINAGRKHKAKVIPIDDGSESAG